MSVLNSEKQGKPDCDDDQKQRLRDGAACLEAALGYRREFGWSVLPCCPWDHVGVKREHGKKCKHRGKCPLVPWKEYMTRLSTEADIRGWWKHWPNANLGCALGPVSKLLRVDADGPGGEAKLQQLSRGDLPLTWEFVSGRANGGRGLLYSIPEGVTLKTTPFKDGEKKQELHLQGEGAQTILPPSRHYSGDYYRWKPGHAPGECKLALAPVWLVEEMRADRAHERNGQHVAGGEPIEEGKRHDALVRMAGAMRRVGMGADEIFAGLWQVNIDRCDPPCEEDEVREIADDIADRYEPAKETPVETTPTEPSSAAVVSAENPWPKPLPKEAFHGLAGEIVRVIEPHSEADPAALLVQVLVGFGNALGRTAHFRAEASVHYLNEFVVLVGKTSKGRKGTSWGHVRQALELADEQWAADCIASGLSSGEGVIHAVRNSVVSRIPVKDKGRVTGHQEVELDPGVTDKRLLVYEPEYASVLRQIERQGNTLSTTLRQAWETGDLRTLTKNNPTRATGAHISVIGHITVEELRRSLSATETANGFANRFAWVCVQRSKLLPEGGRPNHNDVARLSQRMAATLAFGRETGELKRDAEARGVWGEVYESLSEGKPGLAGALLARAEAHVMRLAGLYAVLDQSAVIRSPHLLAALGLWDYVENSVLHVFGDALGDRFADESLRMLRAAGAKGLTRTEIMGFFGRNQPSDRIGRVLGLLLEHKLARFLTEKDTGGRNAERWFALRW